MDPCRACYFTLFHIVLLTLTRGQDTECPEDGRTWVQFGTRCYHFVHGEEDTAKSYSLQDAKEMCKEYDLLTVESAEENEDIIKYSPFVWKGKINIWLGMNYDSDDNVFKWHDDSRLSYKNWEYGGSDDLSLMDTCVALNTITGKWKNISCTNGPENGVVCKTWGFYYCEYGKWEDTDTGMRVPVSECPEDGRTWVQFGYSCYHFVHGEEDTAKSYSLQDAKEMCKPYGLLTVESAEENEDIIKYSPFVWKGKINIWLGMYNDSDDNVFKWHDDSRLSYNNWEYGGSDDLSLMDTCVALNTSTGKWKNISCTNGPENGVVCKTWSFFICEGGGRMRDPGSVQVIISVVLILTVCAVVWFLHQRKKTVSSSLNLIKYQPPVQSLSADQTCLTEAEGIEKIP